MSDTQTSTGHPDALSLDEITEGAEFLTDTTIETPDGEQESLADIAIRLVEAHSMVEKYKTGSLALTQALDEAIIEHQGNDEVVDSLNELKYAAFGVYLRVQRGDAELAGDREGRYSGYYEEP